MTRTNRGSFFSHPIWRKFIGKRLKVICLRDTEHRLRDAQALMDLSQFLPPPDSGITEFLSAVVPEKDKDPERRRARWPVDKLLHTDGLIMVGRPSLFDEGETFLDNCSPEPCYKFCSEDPRDKDYHAIQRADLSRQPSFAPPFADQRKKMTGSLFDVGLIYSGYHEKIPVLVLAGSTSMSTAGLVKFVTEEVTCPTDIRWHEDIQGIALVKFLEKADKTFSNPIVDYDPDSKPQPTREGVESKLQAYTELVAPMRLWMRGKDLPAKDRWAKAYQDYHELTATGGGEKTCRWETWINERLVSTKAGYVPTLALLALACQNVVPFEGGHWAHGSAAAITTSVRQFLNSAHLKDSDVRVALRGIEENLRRAGCIFMKKGLIYSVAVRPLPGFLPSIL